MQKQERKDCTLPHHIIMQERKRLEMTGVSDVDSFDDSVVVAYTSLGAMVVRGMDLHITKLNLDDGILTIEGQIAGISYEAVQKSGFLGRLFR